jgi:hypothetical protein
MLMRKRLFDVYLNGYGIFKILPIIAVALTIVFSVFIGIADGIEAYTIIGEELEMLAVVIWILIGFVSAAINFLITVIIISPTVVRTDATLEMAVILKNSITVIDNSNDKENQTE